jgi:methyltransferase (TIGR00027 family)
MLSGQPSRTLLRAAIRQAAHQLLDEPRIFEDPVVVGLVPEASEPGILATLDDQGAPDSKLFRILFAVRNRFAEDRLAAAAGRGVRQYVMIAAGLDTFPWRQAAFARDMQIFAADFPASLEWTRQRFGERGLVTPANLTFVPLDLELSPH